MSKKNVFLTLTAAISIEGDLVMPGETIEVTEKEARNLLARGKGVLASAPEPTENLDRLTVDALREIASEAGILNYKDLKKAELIEAIKAAGSE